jgi:hypothetical protein
LTTHLIIPDSHSIPGKSNKRYEYIGHLINDVKPDVVIDIGDWADMESLCSYDKGKASFEGRRYKKDIEAAVDAQDRMLTVIRRQKRRLPRFVRCLGNHEYRIVRALERDPILEGTIGLSDLQSKEYGWEEYPFLEPVEIDGISYAHYFITGISGKAIGGDNHARLLLQKQLKSCTQGHSHLFDYCVRTDATGRRIQTCVVGSYLDYWSDWAGPSNKLWNNGIVIKRNVDNGAYDLQHVSLKALKAAYGGRD